MEIVAYSQQDARWADERLGTGELSIGQVGCLLTSAAAMVASWGVSTDPGRLNRQIMEQYGYMDDNLFVFASIDGLACRFVEYIDCRWRAAPVDRLQAALGGGAGVLICVDFRPGGQLEQHWCQLLALNEHGGKVMDPWQRPGDEIQELGRYLAQGWQPARGIFAAAIYSRLEGRTALAWRSNVEAHQGAVCVRG